MVPERLWCCIACVVMGCPFSCTGPASCQAELQLSVGSCRLGGLYNMFIDPQKATLDSLRTLLWFVSYRRLALKFQHSLPAVSLGICICDCMLLACYHTSNFIWGLRCWVELLPAATAWIIPYPAMERDTERRKQSPQYPIAGELGGKENRT